MPDVILAPLRWTDAAEVIRANLASRAFHAPWVQPPANSESFEAWFGQTVVGPNRSLLARDGESGAIAGVLNLSQIVWGGFRSAYLGYYGMAGFARRGLMTEALRLTVRHAFGELGLHRLEANIQPGNLPSRALAQRAGFRLEGFSPRYLQVDGAWRDHERWAVLADNPPG